MSLIQKPFGFGVGGRAPMSDAPQTDLILHWRADTGVTIATGVSSWVDQAGSYDAIQATTSKQPAYSDTSGANGLDGITFDGTDDFLRVASLTLTQPFHGFMVFKMVSHTEVSYYFHGGWTLNSIGGSPNISLQNGVANACTNSFTLGTFFLCNFSCNGASSYIAQNADAGVGGNPGGVGQTNFTLDIGGYSSGGGTSWIDAVFSEILFYSSTQTGSDLTDIQNYLNGQYELW